MLWEMAGTWREKSYCKGCRAAADWQLEADAEWWRIILNKVGSFPPHTVDCVIEEFKQSMRPLTDN